MNIPNVDSMNLEELQGFENTTKLLNLYAHWKILAVKARLEGYIAASQVYENACNESYRKLPESARW